MSRKQCVWVRVCILEFVYYTCEPYVQARIRKHTHGATSKVCVYKLSAPDRRRSATGLQSDGVTMGCDDNACRNASADSVYGSQLYVYHVRAIRRIRALYMCMGMPLIALSEAMNIKVIEFYDCDVQTSLSALAGDFIMSHTNCM